MRSIEFKWNQIFKLIDRNCMMSNVHHVCASFFLLLKDALTIK